MKIYIQKVLLLLVMAAILSSCKKSFQDLYENPNKPTSVQASLLLNGILNNMLEAPGGQLDRTNQYQLQNNSYFGNNQYNFGPGSNLYPVLTDVTNMEKQSITTTAGALNPYTALGKFFRAYFFTKMSLQMGDIPMSQALQGAAQISPVYDAQKTVFMNSLDLLEQANADMTTLLKGTTTFTGDIYFNNSLQAWQKVVNTYRLRLLIHLSKKAADPDLKVAQQFAQIITNPTKYPLMNSTGDDLKYTWLNPTNRYPLNKETFANGALNNSADTYVGLLTADKDPRVFITTDPAPGLVSSGLSPTDFAAFQGGNIGLDMGVLASQNGGGKISYINRYRYYSGYTGETTALVGYTEMCFNIAEAINRGWINGGPLGDAEAYYNAGIKASMAFYGVPDKGSMTVYSLPLGVPVTGPYVSNTVNVDYNAYYAQPAVKYAGNNETGIRQINEQKYIAFFLNSGLEPYFNWRRTGYPVFKTGVGTGNNGKIALRYKYFAAEQSANTANYNAAIAQYNNVDDVNGVMWILK
ncbi:SusD/RagB family nutrient-binding outer membrane lipoprotein [Mucilaginibacter sp. HC2]|uniref:SusD/RagB family nutrient-binding outer membrane lipoprotein n=1 Tax=Mucilaginibacter inviolabilis TaxID=2714892 RepID=UPI001409DC73|nr:SusD/RagB family nutrient-binding outer membrane lipoprotein [Mucilaginibacter inviolabilis]NHA06465.1 SusD/RagB family nutrient-binding outer membrane lipoprotein [Mucilaginibacter inviolabilis]